MSTFSTLMVVYGLVLLAFGYWVFRQRGVDDFLIAGRKNPGLVMGAGIVIGWVDALWFLFYATMGYIYGWALFAVFVPACVVGFAVLYCLVPHLKKISSQKNMYTMGDWFGHRYNKLVETTVGVAISVFAGGWLIALFISVGLLLHEMFGFGYQGAVISLSIITLALLLKGGYGALTRFDVLQFAILIALMVVIFGQIGWETTQNAIFYADGFTPLTVFDAVNFSLLAFCSTIAVPDVWQRMHASRDMKQARLGFVTASLFIVPLFFATGWFGVYARQIGLTVEDPNLVFPLVVESFGPTLVAFVLLTVIVATLSTLNVASYASASAVVHNTGRKVKEKNLLKGQTQRTLALLVIAATVVACLTQDILALGLAVLSLTVCIAPALVFGILTQRSVDNKLIAVVMWFSLAALAVLLAVGANTGMWSLLPVAISTLGTAIVFLRGKK